MKNKIITLTLMLVFLISCNPNKTKQEILTEYYDTGEVFKTQEKINDHECYARAYFKGGKLMAEGTLRDSLKEGVWKAYYSDGVLRGEAIFSKNQFIEEIITPPVILDFRDNPTDFKVGNYYLFRVLGASHFVIEIPIKIFGPYLRLDDTIEPYLYAIKPRKAGTDTIMVVTNIYSEGIKNDTIFFPITIVE